MRRVAIYVGAIALGVVLVKSSRAIGKAIRTLGSHSSVFAENCNRRMGSRRRLAGADPFIVVVKGAAGTSHGAIEDRPIEGVIVNLDCAAAAVIAFSAMPSGPAIDKVI